MTPTRIRTTLSKAMVWLGMLTLAGSLVQWILPYQDNNSQYQIRGQYAPQLNRLQSVEQFVAYFDSVTSLLEYESGSEEHLKLLDETMRYRFYHGTSRYHFSENYIAALSGQFFWDDVRMISLPDDILKHNNTLCNQSCIVFQALLEYYGYRYRAVYLNNHIATEVWYNEQWNYHDPDYEPVIPAGYHSAARLMAQPEVFRAAYDAGPGKDFNKNYELLLSTSEPIYGEENEQLASNLQLFQTIAWWASNFGWLIFFLLWRALKPKQ